MFTNDNRVKRQLEKGKVPVGIVCRTLSPTVIELVGLAGFDFVWLDMEHSTADFALIENLCRAADAVDLESLVRIPDRSPANVLRALEAGAAIVNVPQVNTRDEAEAVVRAAKFAPQGGRGLSPSSRGMRYGMLPEEDPYAAANRRVMTMVQIESLEGVKNIEDICAVKYLDSIFIGLADLSQSLGVQGKTTDKRVTDSATQVIQSANSAGKSVMIIADSPESARE